MPEMENKAAARRFFLLVWNQGEVSHTADFLAEGFVSHNTMIIQ
jgi:hypothetical protein